MNDLLWFLLVGLIAGWLAGSLVKGGGFGLVGDLCVGVLGAVLGGYLFGSAGIGVGGLLGSILVATLGAVILLVLLRVVRRLT
ncbi:GlsB/YeaQ/YmgE family stress response membrane protein [Desulfolutivibrio sulfoxidireducens]|uniref:GlsB/YeaQ/YmgE family stress response membrane protein n=1 Tax=Desulfolutivibrio sulfoxidireducens TaxID=2773299 RepID=UPI00159E9C68|nr:GlsB/YeaQ/YmgE family stress response membrane protein [Desulfolutivibrio sulfoxidireducens]QLA15735.1 GlsB/YeaQ/YmgE family stress response membrane protein [Desulfolutivibrio sulfoxidireducens]